MPARRRRMALVLHDTLERRDLPFEPLEPPRVRMYNCGPTVYSYAHIGNFCAFMLADLLRRTLEWEGYPVTQVMNITDVGHLTEDDVEAGEDKLVAAALREGKPPRAVADFYLEAFHQDRRALGILDAHHYPRATDHVPGMVEAVRRLLERGHAYEAQGEVYFDITTFPAYGRLSGNTLDELNAGARVAVHAAKRNPRDFALWKRDTRHLMQWDAPWGRGFPGWHIECSVMSMALLGESLDIHTGGEDNIFPHHESEIAQSEALTGRPFVRHWLHTRHLLVDGRKMAKSAGNFHTVRDLLGRGHEGRTVRYLLLSTHYRQQQNFTLAGLDQARAALARLDGFVAWLRERGGESPAAGASTGHEAAAPFHASLDEAGRRFRAALDDDLNASAALAALFDFVNATYRGADAGPAEARAALGFLGDLDRVLGVMRLEAPAGPPAEVRSLLAARAEARSRKDWAASDRLRARVREMGWEVLDGPSGQRPRRL
ncbi:MAG: cysteine--tRNA ligase [Planctomycetes bacterium]|nr:cysteine--tRNA ligase [Planctomycetota bacterium]